MALTDNLISYWKMDSNANDTVGSNNGTATSVTFSTGNGKINEGAGGLTTSSKIEVADHASLNMTSAVSFAFWCNTTSTGGQYHTFIAKGNANGYIMRVDGANSKYEMYLKLGATLRNVKSATTIVNGSWKHIVGTYDGSTMKIYVDGSLSNSASFSGSIATTSAVLGIGHDITDGGNNVHLIGAIDEVGIWSRALTSDEVSLLYNGGAGNQYPFSTGSATYIPKIVMS